MAVCGNVSEYQIRINNNQIFSMILLYLFHSSTNLRMTHLQAFGFGFSQGTVFFLYAGCFRFGAYMVSIGEMTPQDVYK